MGDCKFNEKIGTFECNFLNEKSTNNNTNNNLPSLNNLYQQYLDNQKFSNILNGVNAGIQGIGTIYGIMNMQKQWNIMNKQYNLAKEQWDRTKEELDRIKQVRDTWNKKYFSKGV